MNRGVTAGALCPQVKKPRRALSGAFLSPVNRLRSPYANTRFRRSVNRSIARSLAGYGGSAATKRTSGDDASHSRWDMERETEDAE